MEPTLECGSGSHSDWYAYTAGADGELVVDTAGSEYDTLIDVWTGTLTADRMEPGFEQLAPLTCNDEHGRLHAAPGLVFEVSAGESYVIRVMAALDSAGGPLPADRGRELTRASGGRSVHGPADDPRRGLAYPCGRRAAPSARARRDLRTVARGHGQVTRRGDDLGDHPAITKHQRGSMHPVVEREQLSPNVVRLVVEAPRIAKVRRPGQFVIVRKGPGAERIPLTIADNDPEAGTITLMIQAIGASTTELTGLQVGEAIQDVAGPLGRETDLIASGHAVCVGGGVGTAVLLPIVRALAEQGRARHQRHRRPLEGVGHPGEGAPGLRRRRRLHRRRLLRPPRLRDPGAQGPARRGRRGRRLRDRARADDEGRRPR